MKKFFSLTLAVLFLLLLCSCTNVKNNDIGDGVDSTQKNVDEIIVPEEKDTPKTDEEQTRQELPTVLEAVLYFPDSDALYLHPEIRTIELFEGDSLEYKLVELLFEGPSSLGLSPSLEGENLINSVKVSDGICTVDFKSDFSFLNSGGTARETFAIGSIVNTLCELEHIEKVKINIDGNTNAAFGGHFTLEAPFDFQRDLIAK